MERLKDGVGYLILLGIVGVLGLGFFLGSSGLFVRTDDMVKMQAQIAVMQAHVTDLAVDVKVIQQELQDRLPPRAASMVTADQADQMKVRGGD